MKGVSPTIVVRTGELPHVNGPLSTSVDCGSFQFLGIHLTV